MIGECLRSKTTFRLFFALVLMLCALSVFAGATTGPNQQTQSPYLFGFSDTALRATPGTMVETIARQIPNLMRMVTAVAYVMGMYFMVFGVIKLKHFGESRSLMSQEHSIKTPIIYLSVGAFLLYFPTTVHVGLSTFWTNPSPYGYDIAEKDQWVEFLNMCFLIIQLVGTIAFIRGLVILTQLGGHAQQGTFARGLTHIIGGIFCINIYQFVQVILISLGLQT